MTSFHQVVTMSVFLGILQVQVCYLPLLLETSTYPRRRMTPDLRTIYRFLAGKSSENRMFMFTLDQHRSLQPRCHTFLRLLRRRMRQVGSRRRSRLVDHRSGGLRGLGGRPTAIWFTGELRDRRVKKFRPTDSAWELALWERDFVL